MTDPLKSYLQTAINAAQKAGQFINENRAKISGHDVQHKGFNDWVTYVDQQSEQIIVNHILKTFPSHAVLAEEGSGHSQNNENEFLWVIDPLDGTANFVRDIAHFAVSIALMQQQKTIVGVIFNPTNQELFTSAKGAGSQLNGQAIYTAEPAMDQLGFGATGFPFRLHHLIDDYTTVFNRVLRQSSDLRRMGSAALDLANVACGRFHFFFEAYLKPWDFMAGKLLVEEAGGITSTFDNLPLGLDTETVIACEKSIHPRLQQLIAKNFHFLSM
jgi:myo-inositol-1(or 4)-monophosphatase